MFYVITENNKPVLCIENDLEVAIKLMHRIWVSYCERDDLHSGASSWTRMPDYNNPTASVTFVEYTNSWFGLVRERKERTIEFRIEKIESTNPAVPQPRLESYSSTEKI